MSIIPVYCLISLIHKYGNGFTMIERPQKLLEQMRDALRVKHYSYHTEVSYVSWIRRYILFHNKRHPQDMGRAEMEVFFSHLAVVERISARYLPTVLSKAAVQLIIQNLSGVYQLYSNS
jgi:hypothetical protein